MNSVFTPKRFLIKEQEDAPWVIYYLVDTQQNIVELATLGSHVYEHATYEEIGNQYSLVVQESYLESTLLEIYHSSTQEEILFYDLWTDQLSPSPSVQQKDSFSYVIFQNYIDGKKVRRKELHIG